MAVVATLMDKARQKRGIPSDNALAGALGRSRQVVSQWRSGDAYPDEELIVALAEMAGDNPAEWLVAVKAVRSDGKAGKVWAALAKRLGAAAAVVLCAIGFALPVVGKAHEIKASAFNAGADDSAHCILCKEGNGPSAPGIAPLLAASQASAPAPVEGVAVGVPSIHSGQSNSLTIRKDDAGQSVENWDVVRMAAGASLRSNIL